MKVVRSMLTAVAIATVLSASFSWAQCCGGASYNTVGAVAPADASGCGYTVMRTQRRVVYEQQQQTRYRTQYNTVWEEVQVPVTRTVRETAYRTQEYTVRRPVRETSYRTVNYTVRRPVTQQHSKTVNYTVRRPVREMQTRTVNYTVRVPYTEQKQVTYNVRRPVREMQTRTVNYTVRVPVQETRMRTVRKTIRVPYTENRTVTVRGGHWETRQETIPGRSYTRRVRTRGSWSYRSSNLLPHLESRMLPESLLPDSRSHCLPTRLGSFLRNQERDRNKIPLRNRLRTSSSLRYDLQV